MNWASKDMSLKYSPFLICSYDGHKRPTMKKQQHHDRFRPASGPEVLARCWAAFDYPRPVAGRF